MIPFQIIIHPRAHAVISATYVSSTETKQPLCQIHKKDHILVWERVSITVKVVVRNMFFRNKNFSEMTLLQEVKTFLE